VATLTGEVNLAGFFDAVLFDSFLSSTHLADVGFEGAAVVDSFAVFFKPGSDVLAHLHGFGVDVSLRTLRNVEEEVAVLRNVVDESVNGPFGSVGVWTIDVHVPGAERVVRLEWIGLDAPLGDFFTVLDEAARDELGLFDGVQGITMSADFLDVENGGEFTVICRDVAVVEVCGDLRGIRGPF